MCGAHALPPLPHHARSGVQQLHAMHLQPSECCQNPHTLMQRNFLVCPPRLGQLLRAQNRTAIKRNRLQWSRQMLSFLPPLVSGATTCHYRLIPLRFASRNRIRRGVWTPVRFAGDAAFGGQYPIRQSSPRNYGFIPRFEKLAEFTCDYLPIVAATPIHQGKKGGSYCGVYSVTALQHALLKRDHH